MPEQRPSQPNSQNGSVPNGIDDHTTWLSKAQDALMQADTVLRSASNVVTFGLADNVEAAGDSVFGPGGLSGFQQRYQANLAAQKARDEYDATHRHIADTAGKVGGFGIALVAGPEDLGILSAPRMAEAKALTAADAGAILGGGAASGAASQVASDVLTGQKPNLKDTAAGAVGGAADAGATLLLGPRTGGAVGGAVTSFASDILNGRRLSLDNAFQNALAGKVAAHVADSAAQKWASGLSIRGKGKLGEQMGAVRSMVNGLPREAGSKTKQVIADSLNYWFPDGRSGAVRFEDKFGPKARLSPNQTLAQQSLGSNFWGSHFLPNDVGAAASIPTSMAASQATARTRTATSKPRN